MRFEELIDNPPLWVNADGPHSEIVLSSRVNLARNLDEYFFPTMAEEEQLDIVANLVKDAAVNSINLKDVLIIQADKLSKSDFDFVKERHLLLGDNKVAECLVTRGEMVSIHLNEEDHIKIESRLSGLALDSLYSIAFEIDDAISSKLVYSFREDFGYLTSCPTNLGTGMKLSCVVHLPGLVLTKELNKLVNDSMARGLSFKGVYGKDGEIEGGFFQLSNLKTLGISEEDIVNKIDTEVRTIVGYEREARNKLKKEVGKRLEDKIWRAYGILKHSRMLSQKEFLNLSSAVRLGIGLGLISNIDLRTLNYLLLYTGPAHLQKIKEKEMDEDTIDVERAKFVREVLR